MTTVPAFFHAVFNLFALFNAIFLLEIKFVGILGSISCTKYIGVFYAFCVSLCIYVDMLFCKRVFVESLTRAGFLCCVENSNKAINF